MKLRALALLLGVAVFSTSAIAQIGIYGKFNVNRFADTNTQTTTWFYGPSAGIYYDFIHLGPVAFGADLRGNLLWANQEKYRSALFGLRLAVKPPLLPFRPYVQGSVGVGGPKQDVYANGLTAHYSNKFEYQVLGGLDYAFFNHLDWRVAEVGYGRMTGIANGTSGNPAFTFVTISSGIVLRLP